MTTLCIVILNCVCSYHCWSDTHGRYCISPSYFFAMPEFKTISFLPVYFFTIQLSQNKLELSISEAKNLL